MADELDELAQQEMTRWQAPGLALGILHDSVAETRAYGVGSLVTGQPLTADALFRVASLSKVFTATLVMGLVDEGRLDLDQPVINYLPNLRLADAVAQEAITLRHLLSHQSGLLGDFSPDCGLGDDALERAIRLLPTLRQLTAPSELWAYGNAGFHLAGAVAARVLGTTFEEAMRERLFAPLRLERACYFAHEMLVHPFAVGHDPVTPGAEEHRVAPQYYPRNRNPAGGVIAHVGELLRFAACHLNDGALDGARIISEVAARAMRQPQIVAANFAQSYGIGWAVDRLDEVTVVSHSGSINGYQSRLTLVPERRVAVVILTNSGRGKAAIRPIERWLLDRHCGIREADPAPYPLDADTLAGFAGVYQQLQTRVIVTARDGHLDLDTTATDPQSNTEVVYPTESYWPIGDREFVATAGENAGARIDFVAADGPRPRFLRAGGRLHDYVENMTPGEEVWA